MSNFEHIISKARVKYNDAVRGKNYQDELLSKMTEEDVNYKQVEFRKKMFTTEIALLEDVFSPILLNNTQNISEFLEE